MKRIYHIIFYLSCLLVVAGCSSTRRFGTTIERDENNPCLVHIIIQIGVQGTDEDVNAIKKDLDNCFKDCFIPCENNKEKGCMTKVTTVVKKWGSIKEDEQEGFHYVAMLNDDGLPSTAFIGIPNRATPDRSCYWRRNQPPGVYCHEVLHLCGLEDKYCSRIYDPVKDSVITELVCNPAPDPGGNCCLPSTFNSRCSTPCPGHEHNLMATISAGLSCDNITDVLKGAGMNNCPPECCNSDKTFTKPPDELYIIPGYLHFGDKNTKFGAWGASLGYTKQLGSSLGVTIEGGYYQHSKKEEDGYKQTSGLLNITGGISYKVVDPKKSEGGISVTTHALLGISRYTQKTTYNNNSNSQDATSFHFNVGGAVNLQLKKNLMLRILQADYAPTFFYEATQHNFRISTGLVLQLDNKKNK